MDNKMPGFVLDAQRDGREPSADEIYTQTLEWLRERHMDSSVPPSVLQRYAVCSARWLECETQISKFGLLIRSGASKAEQSPYVVMSQNYFNQANKLWFDICQLVLHSRQGRLF